MKDMFEINNRTIRETMNSIARKVKSALPLKDWGFLLMLFEYGTDDHPGSTFYTCTAQRQDAVNLLKDWIKRQDAVPDGEVGVTMREGRKMSARMDTEWHKVCALLLLRLGSRRIEIAEADIRQLDAIPGGSVVFGEPGSPDKLVIRLVDGEEARRLVAQGART